MTYKVDQLLANVNLIDLTRKNRLILLQDNLSYDKSLYDLFKKYNKCCMLKVVNA